MKLSFTKMQGCANVIFIWTVALPAYRRRDAGAFRALVPAALFHRRGRHPICICAAPVTAGADGMMRIFNADGSEGKMCGNGIPLRG